MEKWKLILKNEMKKTHIFFIVYKIIYFGYSRNLVRQVLQINFWNFFVSKLAVESKARSGLPFFRHFFSTCLDYMLFLRLFVNMLILFIRFF